MTKITEGKKISPGEGVLLPYRFSGLLQERSVYLEWRGFFTEF
ncbi:MAG TPA: hypothetical protein PLJ96_00945 [Candidatus Atribacteria bacterium]|nr:hypothetical protein [Candidatus Atribacteria bacterium]